MTTNKTQYDLVYSQQDLGEVSSPRYYDLTQHLVPVAGMLKREVWPSKMFTIKLELKEFEKHNPDQPVFDASQGDGGLSLGGIPPIELAEALKKFLPEHQSTKYGDPVGRQDVRLAIFQNYYGFDSNSNLSPDNIIIGDGGRDLLQKWYQLVMQDESRYGDDILVSAAPWGSYPQGSYINGLNMIMAPGEPENAFKISRQAIMEAIQYSARQDRKVVGVIFTSPDNPTGNYSQPEELIDLIEFSVKKGIKHVFVDLMYQSVTDSQVGRYDLNNLYQTLTKEAQQAVIFMDGLTKSAGASNLRNAHLVVGNNLWVKLLKGLATHTVIPNAIGEAAALEVYSQPDPAQHPWIKKVSEPTAQSRKIVRRLLKEMEYKFVCDQGYYAFINIWPFLGKKVPKGMELEDGQGGKKSIIENVVDLKSYLTTQFGLAVIYGSVFKQPHFIRFSYANSPKYTEGSIRRLHQALTALT